MRRTIEAIKDDQEVDEGFLGLENISREMKLCNGLVSKHNYPMMTVRNNRMMADDVSARALMNPAFSSLILSLSSTSIVINSSPDDVMLMGNMVERD